MYLMDKAYKAYFPEPTNPAAATRFLASADNHIVPAHFPPRPLPKQLTRLPACIPALP